ncbi:MAG TPA: glycine-rich protein, partial [Acidimicrobiales bacterium]
MPNSAKRISAALSSLPLLAIGLTVMGAAVVAGPTLPASADVGCTSSGTNIMTVTCPVGLDDTWTVPTGVIDATFNVDGAQGGSSVNGDSGGSPGQGGELTATIPVTAGQTYDVEVGAAGGDAIAGVEFAIAAGAGGAPGGAAGGIVAEPAGGGGGGASIVSLSNDPSNYLLVAGGGGGEGSASLAGEQGGNGGGTAGSDGGEDGFDDALPAPGGTQAAGSGSGTQIDGSAALVNTPGGGGGGGYWGGAGAAGDGGGGGGSGFAPSASDFLTATKSGNGLVTITYTVATSCSAPTGTIPGPFTVTCPVGIADAWTVPTGVASATFNVDGGEGGTPAAATAGVRSPGQGGELTASLPVTAGQIYSVEVGAAGGAAIGGGGVGHPD